MHNFGFVIGFMISDWVRVLQNFGRTQPVGNTTPSWSPAPIHRSFPAPSTSAWIAPVPLSPILSSSALPTPLFSSSPPSSTISSNLPQLSSSPSHGGLERTSLYTAQMSSSRHPACAAAGEKDAEGVEEGVATAVGSMAEVGGLVGMARSVDGAVSGCWKEGRWCSAKIDGEGGAERNSSRSLGVNLGFTQTEPNRLNYIGRSDSVRINFFCSLWYSYSDADWYIWLGSNVLLICPKCHWTIR